MSLKQVAFYGFLGFATIPGMTILMWIWYRLYRYWPKILFNKLSFGDNKVANYLISNYKHYAMGMDVIEMKSVATKEPVFCKVVGPNTVALVFWGKIPLLVKSSTVMSFLEGKSYASHSFDIIGLRFLFKDRVLLKEVREYERSRPYDPVFGIFDASEVNFGHRTRYKNERLVQDQEIPMKIYHHNSDTIKMEEDLRTFLDNRPFYDEHKLPYRRGYLLHGKPGTGKSSLVKNLAQKFNLPVFILDSNNTNTDLYKLKNLKGLSILLFEDFDMTFRGREQNKGVAMTFDYLLNCFSGVNQLTEVIWVFTTNDVTCIDPALGLPLNKDPWCQTTRPGRLDMALCLDYATDEQKKAIANQILKKDPSKEDYKLEITTSGFEEVCRARALEELKKVFKVAEEKAA